MTTLDNAKLGAIPGHGPGHGHDHEGSYLTPKGGFWTTVWDWCTTIDHKKLGVMYLASVLFLFFLGGVAAMAVRLELLEPVRTIAGADGVARVTGQLFQVDGWSKEANNNIYNRLFTLHGTIMVFMVIVPGIPSALGNFLLPILIGAKDVAFPRLNLLSWWVYALGSMFGRSTPPTRPPPTLTR